MLLQALVAPSRAPPVLESSTALLPPFRAKKRRRF